MHAISKPSASAIARRAIGCLYIALNEEERQICVLNGPGCTQCAHTHATAKLQAAKLQAGWLVSQRNKSEHTY